MSPITLDHNQLKVLVEKASKDLSKLDIECAYTTDPSDLKSLGEAESLLQAEIAPTVGDAIFALNFTRLGWGLYSIAGPGTGLYSGGDFGSDYYGERDDPNLNKLILTEAMGLVRFIKTQPFALVTHTKDYVPLIRQLYLKTTNGGYELLCTRVTNHPAIPAYEDSEGRWVHDLECDWAAVYWANRDNNPEPLEDTVTQHFEFLDDSQYWTFPEQKRRIENPMMIKPFQAQIELKKEQG